MPRSLDAPRREAHIWAMMLRVVLLLLLLPAFARAETRIPESPAEITLTFAPVVEAAAPAVVNIYARRFSRGRASPFLADPFFRDFFDQRRSPRTAEQSLGSGVALSPEGLIVTNQHVIEDADEIRVGLADGREYPAEVMLSDASADLAILRLEGARDLPFLELADSESLKVGDLVLAIGNPFGVGQTVTSGIVSGLARSNVIAGRGRGYFIQTDTAINPGNSGGALVDMKGRLVGVNSAILTRSGGSNGIGFAIPSRLVEVYLEQVRQGASHVTKPWGGIAVQAVDFSLAEALGLDRPEGVLVREVHPQSPFAGEVEPGDVILSLGGGRVMSEAELDYRLAISPMGRETECEVLRGGVRHRARITLGPAPDTPRMPPILIGGDNPFSGAQVSEITPAMIEALGLPLSAEGVVVASTGGIAQRIGLRPGDVIEAVNGRAVDSPATLEAIARAGRGLWDLTFTRAGQRQRLRFRY